MAAYSTQVVITLAALLASLRPSHGFESIAPTSTPVEVPKCLPHDCALPPVQRLDGTCYEAPADSCPTTSWSHPNAILIYNKTFHSISTHITGYQDNKYCAWNLGPTSACMFSMLQVMHMDMGPREPELTCPHSYNSLCCQCTDHVSVKYSDHDYCLADKECPFPDHGGDDCELVIHDNTSDLIISYRSDAEDRGSGFYIWVTKDVGSVHACSQAQDVDFDIKEMPHSLYGCPVLTHDQLVAHVVRFSDEVMKNITRVGSDDPYLRAHLFMPPQPQCYCYGTCMARSAKNRLEIMKSFASQPKGFSFVSYLNSPDPILREIARVAFEGKLPPLQV